MSNLAKISLFIFGYVACFVISLLSVAGTDDSSSLTRQFLQGTGVEIAGCALMLWIYFKWVRKKFTSAARFSAKIPAGKLQWGIFLVMPFLCMLYAGIAAHDSEVWFGVDKDISWDDILEMTIMMPMIAIFGPLMEELSMRVFSITQFSTRKGQIIAAVATALLFALMHVSRFEIVLFASCVYSASLIVSNNIWISSLLHISFNLATIIIPVLIGIYINLTTAGEYGFCGAPLPVAIIFTALFFIGLMILTSYFKSRKRCCKP